MTAEDDHPSRQPRAFAFDEDTPPKAKTKEKPAGRKPAAIRTDIVLTAAEDDPFLAQVLEDETAEPRPRRGLTVGKVFAVGFGILVSLALGIWVDALIRELFNRLPWLGWVALGATALAVSALLVLAWREFRGLRQLANVNDLRQEIAGAGPAVSAKEARRLVGRVVDFLRSRPETAQGRAALKALDDEIVDGPQLIAFAERELLATLDLEARALIRNAARRVSVVTAVSPRAAIDLAYVSFEAIKLVRAMAALYGGRPGTLGMMRLLRDVVAHLAVTGTVAAWDDLIQQAVGHGIAARLSTRLGEGIINGVMTARIGVSAMDLCRPMPFAAVKRPGTSEFLTDLASFTARESKRQSGGAATNT